MRTMAKLFGRSPFEPLQAHMDCVADCVKMVAEALVAMQAGDQDTVKQLAPEVSKSEHKADSVKNDIRNHLPRSLFLPIDRANLLDILRIQDNLADKAEDIAILLTFRKLEVPDGWRQTLALFLEKNVSAFDAVRQIIHQLDELLESSFGGAEAEKVKVMVDQVSLLEHEADVIQRELVTLLYSDEDKMTYGTFHLWMKLISEVADLSNYSEKLAHRVRMTLERK